MIRAVASTSIVSALLLVSPTPAPAAGAGKGKGGGGTSKAAPSQIGKAAPEINAQAWINTNEPLSMEKLKGKIVVLEYWATW